MAVKCAFRGFTTRGDFTVVKFKEEPLRYRHALNILLLALNSHDQRGVLCRSVEAPQRFNRFEQVGLDALKRALLWLGLLRLAFGLWEE